MRARAPACGRLRVRVGVWLVRLYVTQYDVIVIYIYI